MARTGITEADAQAGKPQRPQTTAEWQAMHEATATMPGPALWGDCLRALLAEAEGRADD